MDDPLLPRLADRLTVRPMKAKEAREIAEREHYLHRKPQVSHGYGLFLDNEMVGIATYGTPASRHLQKSVCPTKPDLVTELNRVWLSDDMPKNSESWFISRTLKQLPAGVVVSYADTTYGHKGTMYQALNFNYALWTDHNRKTPRFDYIPTTEGAHSRDAFRNGYKEKVRRKPKAKYWIVVGNKRERKEIARLVAWPSFDWKDYPIPSEHRQLQL
jgi:hypothetical protein